MNSPVFIWILIAVSFTTYFTVNMVYKKLGVNTLETALMATNGLLFLNLKHLFGIILFGIVFFVNLPDFRNLVEYIEIPRLQVLLPFITILLLVAYLSRAAFQKRTYKFTNASDSSAICVFAYLATRFTYLLSIEFFFRGVVLFEFVKFEMPIFAIVSSTFLYGLIYSVSSQKVFFRALALGILLSVVSYVTKSIWYPFLIHLTFFAVYEISLFYDLSFKSQHAVQNNNRSWKL